MAEVLRPFMSADDNTQLEASDYIFIKSYETDSDTLTIARLKDRDNASSGVEYVEALVREMYQNTRPTNEYAVSSAQVGFVTTTSTRPVMNFDSFGLTVEEYIQGAAEVDEGRAPVRVTTRFELEDGSVRFERGAILQLEEVDDEDVVHCFYRTSENRMATDDPAGIRDRRRDLLIPANTIHNYTRPTNRRVYNDGEGEEDEDESDDEAVDSDEDDEVISIGCSSSEDEAQEGEEEGQQNPQPAVLPNPFVAGAEQLQRACERFQADGGLLGRLNRRQNAGQNVNATVNDKDAGDAEGGDNKNAQAPRTLRGDTATTTIKQRKCVPCKKAKKGCDSGNPCRLCAAKGFNCVEHIPKKSGGRCQACKKAQKKCGRRRPCGRCQAHGVGYDGCVPIG